MAIIVEDKRNQKRYFLLGAGFGAYKAIRPSFIGGNLFPHEEEGSVQMVSVCNSYGEIRFVECSLLRVVEIDGMSIKEISEKNNI